MIHRVLAIETSCDDTSVALVSGNGFVEKLVSAHQDLLHAPYGGIVPEIASRNHAVQLMPLIELVLEQAELSWSNIDGIAVTNRPGLMGSLIAGVTTAKTLAQYFELPLIGVNHLEGHLMAGFLTDSDLQSSSLTYPYVALAVSGGHTTLYSVPQFGEYVALGTTRDDAAGEAFDKFGKMVGLGFPGGVAVDRESRRGNPQAFQLPRAFLDQDSLELSFSGLKSAAHRILVGLSSEQVLESRADLCASFQEAVVDVLMAKLDLAVRQTGFQQVLLTGGVSANSRLRERAQVWALENSLNLTIPPIRYCTDNAAMIGWTGLQRLRRSELSDWTLTASPNSLPSDFVGNNR